MILERTEHPMWLSNAYLIAEGAGGKGVLVDGNGVPEPLDERIAADGIEITHVLLTHHHPDHIEGAGELAARYGVPVVAHPICAELVAPGLVDQTIGDGDVVESGSLRIEALHTPGHCADHLALVVNGSDCLTADVIFKGTVGGTRAPGATGFEDLRSSIMDRVLALAPETRLHPGHREPTTVAAEWDQNPFVRLWRGLDDEATGRCTVAKPGATERDPATLVLWAPDYDGTNKAWVRFDDGSDVIVGGSQVDRG